MWKNVLNWIFGILLLVSIILSGVLLYKQCRPVAPEVIYLHDTITIKKDSIVEKLKYVTLFDTVIDVQYKDTILHDTVRIPIEHKVDSFTIKRDSLTITEKIYHNGFRSNIDSIDFSYNFHWTEQIPEPKKKKFGWCITFGPSVNFGINLDIPNKTFNYGPSAGFSVTIGPSYIIK